MRTSVRERKKEPFQTFWRYPDGKFDVNANSGS